MKHTEWLAKATENDAINAIARKAEIVPRTFARQVERDHIDAESIIAIAIAYDLHPVGALVDTGYLEEEWAREIDPARALREVTEDELADEVLRRMKIGITPHGALDTPIDELLEERKNVTPFRNRDDVPEYDPETMVASQESEFIPPDDEFIP